LGDPWVPPVEDMCPCTLLQAELNGQYWWSADTYMKIINEYADAGESWTDDYNSNVTTEWEYDQFPVGSCYQKFNGQGPRCCYGSAEANATVPFWWRDWWLDTLFTGPFASHYERYPILHINATEFDGWIFNISNYEYFQAYLHNNMIGDMIPRRQCCLESQSGAHCKLYNELRPPATCGGYQAQETIMTWGDPHFTTSDGQTYTFNGEGEYWMVYSPGRVSIQTRLAKAVADDGSPSQATAFIGFAAKEDSTGTAVVSFEIDPTNPSGVIVKVNGATQTISQAGESIESIQLSQSTDNGKTKYTAAFPGGTTIRVTSTESMLELELTLLSSAKTHTKGLLGTWNSQSSDDFEDRSGTVINVATLQPSTHLDDLTGALLEQPLYNFGLSWALTDDSESIFTYTGVGTDTFNDHNPSPPDTPPFLENLLDTYDGTTYLNDIKTSCTQSGTISRTCVFDYLVTNRSSIATNTMTNEQTSGAVTALRTNNNPNITGLTGSSIYLENIIKVFIEKT
jgi:hypothetical protein